MKKVMTFLIVMILLCSSISVSATLKFTAEEFDTFVSRYPDIKNEDTEPLLPKITDEEGRTTGYLFEFRGVTYLQSGYSCFTLPQVYKGIVPDVERITAGEYIMERSTIYDGTFPAGGLQGNYPMAEPLRFYDQEENLVHEQLFENGFYHVSAIGYYNGIYYCGTNEPRSDSPTPTYIYKSTDMHNWEKTDEPIPKQFGDYVFANNKTALPRITLTEIIYEGEGKGNLWTTMGEWIIRRKGLNYYFSNDNVYFVKVNAPEGVKSYTDSSKFKCIYEYEDNIVMDFPEEFVWLSRSEDPDQQIGGYYKTLRLTVPKQSIYDELDRMKNEAIYVKLNDAILGFEQMPILESDRTLVPMRFLFEQMGEKVEWDGATQSAIVQGEDDVVTFSIDNTTAKVNGASKTMDVPARLINDKTMVPLRFLSEELGYTVEWDEQNNIATVITK